MEGGIISPVHDAYGKKVHGHTYKKVALCKDTIHYCGVHLTSYFCSVMFYNVTVLALTVSVKIWVGVLGIKVDSSSQGLVPSHHRLAMCELAVKNSGWIRSANPAICPN